MGRSVIPTGLEFICGGELLGRRSGYTPNWEAVAQQALSGWPVVTAGVVPTSDTQPL